MDTSSAVLFMLNQNTILAASTAADMEPSVSDGWALLFCVVVIAVIALLRWLRG
ncbi:hypothetical protein [Pantoea phage LIMEzero]|uniref:Uncharacterized protein n=1 Tax=Pantoea phage LIMEzero TaxID=943335 RepID=F4N9T8_9CAUD|nr:hypothetical protein LIMEzero_ORF35 [Pantoea phage LIMEzero]CBY88566.1 hypothetical protein [Pantoea phage LIMEzero]